LDDIYGMCMYQQGEQTYVFANDADGRYVQYVLSSQAKTIQAKAVRRFKVDSQPEGCVADDQTGRLYVGEEAAGIWLLSADENSPVEMEKIASVGGVLQADVEGLALYHGQDAVYLIASSQGDDSYVVLDANAPYAVRAKFKVALNAAAGIDGTSETDGLAVNSSNLGGAWQAGLMVVQDGRNRMPENNQNFKYIPWQSIAAVLQSTH